MGQVVLPTKPLEVAFQMAGSTHAGRYSERIAVTFSIAVHVALIGFEYWFCDLQGGEQASFLCPLDKEA